MLIQNYLECDLLEEAIKLISKTVKGDRDLICNILFNGLSAFTNNPMHLMIMEKTSEGKTYPVLQIAKHFPPQSVITLGSATPQSFKYDHGIPVDSNYKPISEILEKLNEEIGTIKVSKNNSRLKELEKQRKQLLGEAKYLIDLRGKWIIFKEPPDSKLLEALYSTISNDEEYNEHRFVNKVNGTNQSFKVVFRGSPAILICTARDESRNRRWDETFSRFHVISPLSSLQKYGSGMEIIAKTMSLPKEIYEEHVISSAEKQRLTQIIQTLLNNIKSNQGEILNPFVEELARNFPQESGIRWRQFKRFLALCNLHCLCYADSRPLMKINEKTIPIVIKSDIEWSLGLMKDVESVPPNKMVWFNETFIPTWKKHGIKIDRREQDYNSDIVCITANDIRQYTKEIQHGKTTTKQIRETYLEALLQHGIIERNQDPRNKSRDIYWPSHGFEDNQESSLISTSPLDESCVRSFLEKYIKKRFRFEFKGTEITSENLVSIIVPIENVTWMKKIPSLS